jgi:hypothetical protein
LGNVWHRNRHSNDRINGGKAYVVAVNVCFWDSVTTSIPTADGEQTANRIPSYAERLAKMPNVLSNLF